MIFGRIGPKALFYRALTPRWAYLPESGVGAALAGGRLNRPGVEARYLAQTPEGALLVAERCGVRQRGKMSLLKPKPESQEAVVRIGCGALVGMFVGAAIVVGWASYSVAFAGVFGLSVVVCRLLGWRFGDRFFHSVHKWIGWFR